MYCVGDEFFPCGTGLAHFLVNYGIETNDYWICIMDNEGKTYQIPNTLFRGQINHSVGRKKKSINEKNIKSI